MRYCDGFRALIAAILVALMLAGASAASAQTPAPAAPAEAPVSAAELQRLLDTLQNPQDRAKLAQELRALIAAERARAGSATSPQPTPAAAPAAPPASETSGVPAVLGNLSDQLHAISTEILATATVVIDAPRLVQWVEDQASDEQSRARWGQVLLHLVIVFGLASAVEFAVR